MATRARGSGGLVRGWAEGARGCRGCLRGLAPPSNPGPQPAPAADPCPGGAGSPARQRARLRRLLGGPGLEFRGGLLQGGGGARRPADRRSPNSLCPHPRAGRGPPRRLAPSLSPPTPVCPQEGAGVHPLLLPNKRFGARRAPGRWEAAPSSRLPPFPRNLTGILFATRGQFKVGSRTQNLNRIAKMKS